jgi:hypothetical protein
MNTVLQSPQPAGTTITITASGSGGAAPRQYKWLVKQTPADYQPAKDWSTSTTFDWRPTMAGNYRITLWGRSAGVTSDAAEAAEEIYFAISQPK